MTHYLRRMSAASVLAAAALVSLAAQGAWASPGRAVYVNEQVHRIWVGGNIKHVAGQPRDPGANDWVFVRAGDVQDSGWCASWKYMNGSGLAVFDNKIFYAYTSYSSCQGTAMYAYVGAFDLTKNSWTTLKRLGSVRTDLDSEGAGAGAAITVFDNKLYVFTDSGTYTSGDGVGWSTYNSLLPGGAYQPLDAITYYPPDSPPRILIVYGSPDLVYGPANYYTKISAATWNGQIGAGSDFPATLAVPYNHWVYGHVALQAGTLGALKGYAAGAKTPSVQLFLEACSSSGPSQIRRAEFTYSAASPKGTWRLDPYVYQDGDNMSDLWTYPWYTVACDSSHLSTQARQQTLVVHYHTSSDHAFAGTSDFMVPINDEFASKSCGDWGGSSTNTDDTWVEDEEEAATLRKYWSLYGVVLGSPPFAHNNVLPNEIADLSNVEYGVSTTEEVKHTQQWENISMFSAGLEVRAGLLHAFEVKDRADIGYTHAFETEEETSSSLTTGWHTTLGTIGQSAEELENLGRVGWGIFGVPKVMVQDFRLFAYDYDYLTGKGADLDQDVHVVGVSPTSVATYAKGFRLEDPGGEDDDIPGLMSGIQAFPRSTDLNGWCGYSWESREMPWEVVFGDGTLGETGINPVAFTEGQVDYTYISEETEDAISEGETTKIDISNEFSIDVGTKLKGFKADLKTGYESGFKTTITNTTSFAKELMMSLGMKSCSEPECVKTLAVQPYFLKATSQSTGEKAPWVPTAYSGQYPWCITWQAAYKLNDGTRCGATTAPGRAEGVVVGTSGGDTTMDGFRLSRYSLIGASLGWVNDGGGIEPIPMNAFDFDSEKGVTLDLNGYFWSSRQAHGHWRQQGMVWTFTSDEFVKRDRAIVKLDFGKGTWDFHISRADLASVLSPLSSEVRAALVVNGKYTFQTIIRHQVMTEWTWEGLPDGQEKLGLTSYEGWYDTSSGEGAVSLQGALPETLDTFGDMSFEVNGHPVHVPLLDLPNFNVALEKEGKLVYEREGLHAEVDFAKRTWSASIEREEFSRRQTPLRGKARVRVLVGGVSWGSFDVPVATFRSQFWLDAENN